MTSALKSVFAYFRKIFTVNEWAIIITSVILSIGIATSVLWFPEEEEVKFVNITSKVIKNKAGTAVAPFHSVYFVAYEDNTLQSERDEVTKVMNEYVPLLHKISDPNNVFYIDDNHPELGELVNLRKINQSLGTGEWLEVDVLLYDLLSMAKQFTIASLEASLPGTFNMFLGKISDFWQSVIDPDNYYNLFYDETDPYYNVSNQEYIDTALEYVPETAADVNDTLLLKTEEGRYYVRFDSFAGAKPGDAMISLGAIGKGYANQVLAARLREKQLTRGLIYGGSSSITYLGARYKNKDWERKFVYDVEGHFAYGYNRPGAYDISNSGAYEGVFVKTGDDYVLRHHIIDPATAYPSQKQWEVAVISDTLGGGELDALSTAFMILSKEDGMILRDYYLEAGERLEVVWVEPSFAFSMKELEIQDGDGHIQIKHYVDYTYTEIKVFYTENIEKYLVKYDNVAYFGI